MKSKFYRVFLAMAIALGMFAFSTGADAYQCRWVNAHYVNGYYHPGHRVCWHNGNGYYHHYRHCGWRNGHRVCWYN